MKHAMSSITVAVLMSIYAAGQATSASAAGSAQDGLQVTVHYSDLDISRPEGAQELLRRIHYAAVQTCFGQSDALQLQRLARFKTCMHDTMDRTVASLNNAFVASYYDGARAQVANR